MKLRGLTTKYILRQAMRDSLPKGILSRKKMGFPVPVGAWLRGRFRHILNEYVLHPRALERGIFNPDVVRNLVARHYAGEKHDERLWALINFEIWQRRFLDGEHTVKPIEAVPVSAGTALQTTKLSDWSVAMSR
jgi:asparagine synthase (glutamine-hydrolysing)